MAGGAQHPGRGSGRGRQPDDPQSAQSLLRPADENQLGAGQKPKRKSGRNGNGFRHPASVIENLNTAVVLLDQFLIVSALNAAAENLLGVSKTRARGQPFLPLVDDDAGMQAVLSRTLDTGEAFASELKLAPTEANADERAVECRVSLMSPGDAEACLLIEMIDVTRRSRISRENALIIQHGAGRQMIRQLAHEIKNPLGGLRGAAQLLSRELETDEQQEYTEVIISEADRLVGLVDTLLGPGGPPNKEATNVHELLEYVVKLIVAESGDGLSIVRDYDPGLPLIDLDRDQMVQAILNVVRNAATALDGHGNIVLRTRAIMSFTIGNTRHSAVASIEIEDDGPGIPAEMQDSVFYPLVTSRPDGTGLGLPAAQELISRHDGLIEFDSRPGRTVFFIRIPLAQGEAA